MGDAATDQAPPGQKTLSAPEGCGFMDVPVLPVQIHLMCKECEVPMFCVASVPPLIVGLSQTAPPQPDYIHQCAKCEKKVRMKQPFPSIRYAPHPTFSVATPEEKAAMDAQNAEMEAEATRQMAALNEAFPNENPTSQSSEAPSESSSEEE